MSDKYDYDLIVIGSGPGGYVSAIRASQLGLRVVVLEKNKTGGVCLNVGCIPTKALIHQAEVFAGISELEAMGISIDKSAFDYGSVKNKSRTVAERLSKGVQFLLKKNKIDYVEGEGIIKDKNTVEVNGQETITGENILIASGSRPTEIPVFKFDNESIITSTDALLLDKLPEKMLILGAGVIGMEFAYIAASFGCSVTIVEMLKRVLPNEEPEISDLVLKEFKKKGVKIFTETKALSVEKSGGSIFLNIEKKNGEQAVLEGEKLLVSVGRTPNTQGLGLENIGIKTEKEFIPVGDYYETSVKGVYAIGDVVKTPLLAHVASKEGEIAVSRMAGRECEKSIDNNEIPQAVYCNPQVGSFGLTEEKVKELGLKYNVASFPFMGIGKAVAMGHPEGFIKLISSEDDRLLGCHIVGAGATELIHELLAVKVNNIPVSSIAEMIHAHPTLSEGLMEASRALSGWAIHK